LNRSKLAKILGRIPLDKWDEIVRQEPEWIFMKEFLKPFGFGKFSVLMVMAGLNDFQLKGKAEMAYWPRLKDHLKKKLIPANLNEMKDILIEFYRDEKKAELKINRVYRFMTSQLAERLWRSRPIDVSRDFLDIWRDLANTMRQPLEAKTIVFAMKCLGITLLMVGETSFNFEEIPIPVDFRVKNFSKRLGVYGDEEIRGFWKNVLETIRDEKPINMIHLDSLIWQIGSLSNLEILKYFRALKLENIGRELLDVIR